MFQVCFVFCRTTRFTCCRSKRTASGPMCTTPCCTAGLRTETEPSSVPPYMCREVCVLLFPEFLCSNSWSLPGVGLDVHDLRRTFSRADSQWHEQSVLISTCSCIFLSLNLRVFVTVPRFLFTCCLRTTKTLHEQAAFQA